jgi:plasmid maintenance system killer protein
VIFKRWLNRSPQYANCCRGSDSATRGTPRLRRLDRLDAAATPRETNIPGFDFHALRGFKPTRYSIHVNGPWCITFEFEDGDACRVDFEQYH